MHPIKMEDSLVLVLKPLHDLIGYGRLASPRRSTDIQKARPVLIFFNEFPYREGLLISALNSSLRKALGI
jgi:hypothetical protein